MKTACFTLLGLFCVLCSGAMSQTTKFTYDDLDRLTKVEYVTSRPVASITYSYDEVGNMLSQTQENSYALPGDLNNNGIIDLVDTILGLQTLVNFSSQKIVDISADLDGDGKVGYAEIIYCMQYIATH